MLIYELEGLRLVIMLFMTSVHFGIARKTEVFLVKGFFTWFTAVRER